MNAKAAERYYTNEAEDLKDLDQDTANAYDYLRSRSRPLQHMFKFVELGIEKLREQQQQLQLELEQKKREAGGERLRLGAFGATAGGVFGNPRGCANRRQPRRLADWPGRRSRCLGQAKQREIEVFERELPRLRKIESR